MPKSRNKSVARSRRADHIRREQERLHLRAKVRTWEKRLRDLTSHPLASMAMNAKGVDQNMRDKIRRVRASIDAVTLQLNRARMNAGLEA